MLLPTGAAKGASGRAGETIEVPVAARARRGEKLQPWLAAWLVALLVVVPFAHPSVLIKLPTALGASVEALVPHEGAPDKYPAANLRPAQLLAPGILSRVSLLETRLGLPPLKAPLLQPAPDQPVLALQAVTALGGESREVLQRSSVGTARTPTGPPA